MRKLLIGAVGAFLVSTAAEATFTLNITESGSDVVANGTGTLNLAGLARASQYDTSGSPFLQPGTATVWSGYGAARFYTVALSGPSDVWGSSLDVFDGAGSGDVVYLNSAGLIGVSNNYFSGSLLSSRSSFVNRSFSSMGLKAGTYTYLLGAGRSSDSFIVQIGMPAPSAFVPEPTSWVMMLFGFAFIGGVLRKSVALQPNYGGKFAVHA